MFSGFNDIFESVRASRRVSNALNNGRKPSHKDLRALGVSEDLIKSNYG